jgi:hypothetical protein
VRPACGWVRSGRFSCFAWHAGCDRTSDGE